MSLKDVADELTRRLHRLFLKGPGGQRTYLGRSERQWQDPDFSEALLFHEYFDGDTGEGLGASHQTGWTGLIALLLQPGEVSDIAAATAKQGDGPPPAGTGL